MWYLVGRIANGSYRTYRVARISALTCTDVAFERDVTFDLVAHWKDVSQRFITTRETTFPFYPVLLRLTPEAFATLRDYVPERYEQVNGAEGSGWLTVRVLFLSLHEAQMHVLGLGSHVCVLEPIELHETVLNIAQAIIASPHFSDT
jgi:predicted DNA-binding transcriptional regulator YafY